jgi:hypothetical protein
MSCARYGVHNTYSEYAASGKGENDGIVRNLGCDKIGRSRELELYALDIEYGQ